MPFALSEYDRAFGRFFSVATNEISRAGDPLLSQIQVEESSGPLGSVFTNDEGEDVVLDPGLASAEISMKLDDVRDGNIDELLVMITEVAHDMRSNIHRHVFGTINTVTEATGNVVRGSGQFTFEMFYEALETMEWSLTDDDQLAIPQLYMHPDTVAKLPPETAEQREKVKALQQRKLEELLARRRRRRLS